MQRILSAKKRLGDDIAEEDWRQLGYGQVRAPSLALSAFSLKELCHDSAHVSYNSPQWLQIFSIILAQKYKIYMAFKTSQMDQIALEYWYHGFLGRLRVDGRGFLHQNANLEKLFVRTEIKLPHMRRSVSQPLEGNRHISFNGLKWILKKISFCIL